MRKLSITVIDPETGMEDEFYIPAVWEICPRCNGEGHHSNPSIDGNGITESEWSEWAYEERLDYLEGRYDVECHNKCSDGKVLVPHPFQCLQWQIDAWIAEQEEEEMARWEVESERRMLGGW